MALHRFFATGPVPSSGVLPLTGADVHHARDVVRLAPGERIELAYDGRVRIVEIESVGATVNGRCVGDVAPARDIPRVTLVQSLAKGEKMDDVVRQTTELGIWRIVPLVAERSVVRLDPAKTAARLERWRRIAQSAAKQAHLDRVPEIGHPVSVAALGTVIDTRMSLICWEDAVGAPGIPEAVEQLGLSADSELALIVGPEGGLTEAEVAQMRAAGGTAVSLGPTILRTETAGVVATALALAARSGLGTGRA